MMHVWNAYKIFPECRDLVETYSMHLVWVGVFVSNRLLSTLKDIMWVWRARHLFGSQMDCHVVFSEAKIDKGIGR